MTPIQEYSHWLTQYLKEQHNKSDGSHLDTGYVNGLEYALDRFNELFPEDTQTLSDHLDKIPGMDGEHRAITIGDLTEDETDNIYPKN